MLIKCFPLRSQNRRWKQQDKNNYNIVAKNRLQSTAGKRRPHPQASNSSKDSLSRKKQELVLKSVIKKGASTPTRLNPDEMMNSDKPTPETFLCFSVHLHAQYQTSPRHSQTPIYPHTNTFLKAIRGTVPLHRKRKQKQNLSTPWTRIDMTWSCTTGTWQLYCRYYALQNANTVQWQLRL